MNGKRKMKTNNEMTSLHQFLLKPKQIKNLAKAVDSEKYETVVNILSRRFPQCTTMVVPVDIIMEVGYVLAQPAFDDDFDPDQFDIEDVIDDYQMTLDYLRAQTAKHSKRREELRQEVSRKSYDDTHGKTVIYATKDERAEAGYTEEVVSTTLANLDLQYQYVNYTDGYNYWKNQLNIWLIREIDETLKQIKTRK